MSRRGPRSDRVLVRTGLVLAGLALAFVSVWWLSGERRVVISPEEMTRVEGQAVRFLVPRMVRLGSVTPRVTEGGVTLGPEVQTMLPVRDDGEGRYREMLVSKWSIVPRYVLFFSSSDRTDPRRNSRRYVIDFPRTSLLDSWVALFAFWGGLGLLYRRLGRPARLVEGAGDRTPRWSRRRCAVSLGLLAFSIYAFQAPSLDTGLSGPWLALVALCFLMGVGASGGPRLPGPVGSCILAFGLWASSTVVLPLGGRGETGTLRHALLVCSVGLLLSNGVRLSLAKAPARPVRVVMAATGTLTLLLTLQGLGIDLGSWLSWGGRAFHARTIWVDKFAAHWLVTLGWLTISQSEALRPRDRLAVAAGVTFALWCSGSRTGLLAWGASGLVYLLAVRWPDLTRRVVVGFALLGVLTAPWTARVPWQLLTVGLVDSDALFSRALDLGERGPIWETAGRLVTLRPSIGWGLGASSNLCEAGSSLAELLGEDASRQEARPTRPVLPGGHPHNAALQIWLDLGFVGALLAAFLISAVGSSIGRFRERVVLHGGLLALLSTHLSILSYNYPLWNPVVLAALWVSALAVVACVPRRESTRPWLRWGPIVVALLGSSWGVVVSVHQWAELRSVRAQQYSLAPGARAVTSDGDRAKLSVAPGLRLWGARLVRSADGLRIQGRVLRSNNQSASGGLLLFVDQTLLGVVWPSAAISAAPYEPVWQLVPGFDFPLDEGLHAGSRLYLVDPDADVRSNGRPLGSVPIGEPCASRSGGQS